MGQATSPVSRSTIINPVNVTGTEPRIIFTETDAAANAKKWDIDVNAGVLSMRTRTDADGAGVTFLTAGPRVGTSLQVNGVVLSDGTGNNSLTIAGDQMILRSVDEIDSIAKVFTLTATGAAGASTIDIEADGSIILIAGNASTGGIQLQSLTSDITISAGGADGDIALVASGTGTIDVTGQIVMNQPQLARSSVAYTNNAGAQVATLNNGPTAGNPTKWIPINDNGTIRNIPAW